MIKLSRESIIQKYVQAMVLKIIRHQLPTISRFYFWQSTFFQTFINRFITSEHRSECTKTNCLNESKLNIYIVLNISIRVQFLKVLGNYDSMYFIIISPYFEPQLISNLSFFLYNPFLWKSATFLQFWESPVKLGKNVCCDAKIGKFLVRN